MAPVPQAAPRLGPVGWGCKARFRGPALPPSASSRSHSPSTWQPRGSQRRLRSRCVLRCVRVRRPPAAGVALGPPLRNLHGESARRGRRLRSEGRRRASRCSRRTRARKPRAARPRDWPGLLRSGRTSPAARPGNRGTVNIFPVAGGVLGSGVWSCLCHLVTPTHDGGDKSHLESC